MRDNPNRPAEPRTPFRPGDLVLPADHRPGIPMIGVVVTTDEDGVSVIYGEPESVPPDRLVPAGEPVDLDDDDVAFDRIAAAEQAAGTSGSGSTAQPPDEAPARLRALHAAILDACAATTPVVVDVGDQDTFTTLVCALEDHAAELRDDLHDRIDVFGDDSITVARLQRELATTEQLLEAVTAA